MEERKKNLLQDIGSHYLKRLFEPSSIAIIGATDRPHSVRMKVFQNLLKANFQGNLYPVNPNILRFKANVAILLLKRLTKPWISQLLQLPPKLFQLY